MTTPEDRLRELLRSEADTIVPAGDGLSKIQARVARRRRLRIMLLPGAALATAGAAAAVLVLSGDPSPAKQTLQPGETPSATTAPVDCAGSDTVLPGCPAPTAAPTTAPTVAAGYEGVAIWPFTSPAEAAAWKPGGDQPWASDPKLVTQHFAADFLGLDGLTVGNLEPAHNCCRDSYWLKSGTRTAAWVDLERISGDEAWTVTGVRADGITVTRPTAGAAVTSPLSVTGTIEGLHENVRLQLRPTSGNVVADTSAPAGSEAPWQGTLTWSDTSWTTGAVVGVTRSDKDGSVTRIVVVPVTRATTAPAGDGYAVLRDGHVELVDGTTTRQVTFPPAGASDTGTAYASGTVVWVRTRPTGCHDSLNRLVIGGSATTVVADGTVRIASPRLSPDASTLAWTQTPCGSEQRYVVVRAGGPDRALAAPSGMTAVVRDVTNDGALLVHLNDVAATDAGTLGYLPAGATSLDALVPLAATGSCYLAGAATFDGGITAWETCDGRSRLVHYAANGARGTAGPLVDATSITSAAARDGQQVLEVRSRTGLPSIARYAAGVLTYVKSCTTAAACHSSPDW